MKRKRATEEHHRLDYMSFLGLWRRWDSGLKQHSITMIVIPEEFLPPLGRKEVICFFLSHRVIIIAMINVPCIQYLVQEINTMFKNEQ